jgi:N-acetylglutamate synthase
MNMIRNFEELSLNAWPSLQTMLYDGWIIRFAGGYTKRANSVNPVYASSIDIEKKIAFCEHLFRNKNLPVVFKLTKSVFPENLDELLEQRGYRLDSQTSMQIMEIGEFPAVEDVDLKDDFSEQWLAGFCTANSIAEIYKPVIRRMLDSIIPQKCFAVVRRQEQTIAWGLSVLQNEHVGFFDIVTDPAFRNQGVGKQLMSGLLHWGKRNQASQAYLQVMLNNAPALKLYAHLGFQEAYQYWYRIKK